MEHRHNLKKALVILLLVFSLLVVTACDKAESEKKDKLTADSTKTDDKIGTGTVDEAENKGLTGDKSIRRLTDHPMVIKSDGALRLDLKTGSLPNKDYKVDFIDYDSFFENPSVDLNDERYADVTKDGKVDWTITEEREFKENPIVLELMDKITLDGKKITLPMKFADLGEEYAVFDMVDYSQVTEEMHPFQIVDIKTGNKLVSPQKSILFSTKYFDVLDENNILVLIIGVNMETNRITYIDSNSLDIVSKKNLLIDKIGIGFTLNEVYEHFGHPTKIKNKDKYVPLILYTYGKNNISFNCGQRIHNYVKKVEYSVTKNLITGVCVWCD